MARATTELAQKRRVECELIDGMDKQRMTAMCVELYIFEAQHFEDVALCRRWRAAQAAQFFATGRLDGAQLHVNSHVRPSSKGIKGRPILLQPVKLEPLDLPLHSNPRFDSLQHAAHVEASELAERLTIFELCQARSRSFASPWLDEWQKNGEPAMMAETAAAAAASAAAAAKFADAARRVRAASTASDDLLNIKRQRLLKADGIVDNTYAMGLQMPPPILWREPGTDHLPTAQPASTLPIQSLSQRSSETSSTSDESFTTIPPGQPSGRIVEDDIRVFVSDLPPLAAATTTSSSTTRRSIVSAVPAPVELPDDRVNNTVASPSDDTSTDDACYTHVGEFFEQVDPNFIRVSVPADQPTCLPTAATATGGPGH
ncbi:unnamed protein product, partial [Mesorhabditis spiculigera]